VGTFAETFSGPLVVSSDGALAARFTDDGSASVLSVLTGQVLGRFNIHGDSQGHVGVVFSGDGTLLVGARTSYPQGSYSIIDLDPKNWMRMLCASAGRDFTDAEWLRYTSATKPGGLGCSALK
jgi:WD40 repeat protein